MNNLKKIIKLGNNTVSNFGVLKISKDYPYNFVTTRDEKFKTFSSGSFDKPTKIKFLSKSFDVFLFKKYFSKTTYNFQLIWYVALNKAIQKALVFKKIGSLSFNNKILSLIAFGFKTNHLLRRRTIKIPFKIKRKRREILLRNSKKRYYLKRHWFKPVLIHLVKHIFSCKPFSSKKTKKQNKFVNRNNYFTNKRPKNSSFLKRKSTFSSLKQTKESLLNKSVVFLSKDSLIIKSLKQKDSTLKVKSNQIKAFLNKENSISLIEKPLASNFLKFNFKNKPKQIKKLSKNSTVNPLRNKKVFPDKSFKKKGSASDLKGTKVSFQRRG